MTQRFRHDALFYAGDDEFAAATLPFLRDGVANDEPILVAVDQGKITRLRRELGRDADRVEWVDMARLGRNPACIIPAWQAFLDQHAASARPARGIGEPIWAGRTPAELTECHAHESLLNTAFDDGPPWSLICPYNTAALDEQTLNEARTTHPRLVEGDAYSTSPAYHSRSPYDGELPQPPVAGTCEVAFDQTSLRALRRLVAEQAAAHGMDGRVEDLVLAVNELAVNSIRYGGGGGTLRMWTTGGALVCEVSDQGHIDDVLAGRVRPSPERDGGAGLWLVNHMCDLAQIRSGPSGTVVRAHMAVG